MKVTRRGIARYRFNVFAFYFLSTVFAAIFIAIPIVLALTPLALLAIPALTGLAGGLIVLYSLIPPLKRTPKVGDLPQIRNDELQRDIASLAESIGIDLAPENLLSVENNASAALIGGRCHISLGLPFICLMNKIELKAIILHELAHHDHRDLEMNLDLRWINGILNRIIHNLGKRRAVFMLAPFTYLARRLAAGISPISKRQEFRADARAAETAGPQAMAGALKKMKMLKSQWPEFIQSWYYEFWYFRIKPNLLRLFELYLHSADPPETYSVDAYDKKYDYKSISREYDSHPSVWERLQALDAMPGTQASFPDSDDAIPYILQLEDYNDAFYRIIDHHVDFEWKVDVSGLNAEDGLREYFRSIGRRAAGVLDEFVESDYRNIYASIRRINETVWSEDMPQDDTLFLPRRVMEGYLFVRCEHAWTGRFSAAMSPVIRFPDSRETALSEILTSLFEDDIGLFLEFATIFEISAGDTCAGSGEHIP